jgi:spermidine synthase
MVEWPPLAERVSGAEAAVFVSGVASMGLEILAGRILAPEFGSSIFTWGSIIGVFLAALSLGYHRGGKRARERASLRRLSWLFFATAAYVAVLVLGGDLLLSTTARLPLPPRFASLPAVIVLFGPPTYLLGYVSPYAAELSGTDRVGEASGRVYAVGTVGSIVGAFATTFVLVPSVSIEWIGFAFGALLVVTATGISLPALDRRSVLTSVVVAGLLVTAVQGGAFGVSPAGQTLYQTQTPYQELEVAQLGATRTLYLDGQPHSAMDVDDPTRHVYTYTRYFHLPYLFAEDPDDIDRVLFVGGGGFSGPKRFATEYDATIDVVEIDPEVISVAREYFRLDEYDDINVYAGDGRQYLRDTNHTYDLIVLDAYKKDKVPFQLTTLEFMRLANDRLSPDGILLANLIAAPRGPASGFYRAEYRTIDRAFQQTYTFPAVGGSAVQNVELIATKNPDRVTEETLERRNREREIGIDLRDAIENYQEPPPVDDVPVLRDDRAPVDSLLEPTIGQRYVVEQTTENGSARDQNDSSTDQDEETILDERPPAVDQSRRAVGSGSTPTIPNDALALPTALVQMLATARS